MSLILTLLLHTAGGTPPLVSPQAHTDFGDHTFMGTFEPYINLRTRVLARGVPSWRLV